LGEIYDPLKVGQKTYKNTLFQAKICTIRIFAQKYRNFA
jgi:hypothetical protein